MFFLELSLFLALYIVVVLFIAKCMGINNLSSDEE